MRPALIALASLALAQSIPSDEIRSHTVPYTPSATMRADVRIVEVPVVVRDSHLHTVPGLTRDDFEIDDNGKRQPITAFTVQNFKPPSSNPTAAQQTPPRPRFLALCFDDLHLLPALLNPVKEAAKRFVQTSLAPNDRVIIVRTSRSEQTLFTADVPTLVEQIDQITPYAQAVADDSTRCVHILPHEAYIIAEGMDPGSQLLRQKMAECGACYHNACPETMITGAAKVIWAHTRTNTGNGLAMIDSLIDGMAKLPGQRVILLTSGGFLTGTFETDLDRLMDKARRAEVLINALDARGLYLNLSSGMAYDGMGILASGTGGTFFHNNNGMDEGFRELGMVPETTYLLGFTPPGAPDGSFHKLKVRLAANKGNSIEARLGYTAHPDVTLDSLVAASNKITDLPASFTWEQWSGPPSITMVAHLDIAHLHFKPNDDRQAQRLTIVAVILDQNGAVVAGKRSDLQLNLKHDTYANLLKTGFTAALTLQAPPGAYTARAVAEDAMENKRAAFTIPVEIK